MTGSVGAMVLISNERITSMNTTPETIETYSDSVRAEIRLSERQVAKILDDHSLSFIEFHADRVKCAYDEKTDTWSANDLLAWLGY